MSNHEPFRLDGLTALVTGGASGIGEAICRRFTWSGASVIIADVDKARAENLSKELKNSSVLQLDITNEAAVNAAFQALPKLDILVNNAGIGLVASVEETTTEDFERLFRVNVEGTFFVTKAAMPLLLKSSGNIVNIGSVAGVKGFRRRFAYCATKGAVLAMTKQLALEYAGKIRVNAICPGTTETPFVEAYIEKYHSHEVEKIKAELNARQPVGRLGRPDEMADLALYLASPEAGFVTGSFMFIDGGTLA
ncbi:MAG TPA: SDR family NAD(P)-dependent oxidoreductase [Bryobacteraceae bacterium]|jgi:NAD(P)-dependent dehydrogenase (short-subunit alcohol dehydrogenase family)|nr:SDR family NAD(P)-dependent oxidoreductase [Bryobacteraceae bacterium]